MSRSDLSIAPFVINVEDLGFRTATSRANGGRDFLQPLRRNRLPGRCSRDADAGAATDYFLGYNLSTTLAKAWRGLPGGAQRMWLVPFMSITSTCSRRVL
jgi:hypothetical protein